MWDLLFCWRRTTTRGHRTTTTTMAPGGFSILAPFLGRSKSSKKYEKLETEDPEKKRQEATQEEIQRLNYKIVSN